jgi:hypothetical protein
MNKLYGFEGEVKQKYDDNVYELFQDIFNKLPLGYVLNKRVLVVHGVNYNFIEIRRGCSRGMGSHLMSWLNWTASGTFQSQGLWLICFGATLLKYSLNNIIVSKMEGIQAREVFP